MATGGKLVGLLYLFFAAWGMLALLRRLTRSCSVSLVGALFYAASPSMALSLGAAEHMPVACALVLPPLIAVALLRLEEHTTPVRAAVLGLLLSILALVYFKEFLLILPSFAVVVVALLAVNRRRKFVKGLLIAGLVLFFCVVPLLLPLLREERWMALFRLDSIDAWQQAYSAPGFFAWFARKEWIVGEPAHGGVFYLSVLGVAGLLCGLGSSQQGRQGPFVLCLGLMLLYFWLSFGPRDVLSASRMLLDLRQDWLARWTVKLSVLVPFLLLAWIWPKHRFWWVVVGLLGSVCVVVPGFRVLELIPGYDQIRAPWSLWYLPGTFFLVVAASLGLARGFKRLPSVVRPVALVVALLVLLVDLGPYRRAFTVGTVSSRWWDDFHEVEARLQSNPLQGRVIAAFSNFVFVTLPLTTGKPLVPGFQIYFHLYKHLQLVRESTTTLRWFRLFSTFGGAPFVLIDKTSSDIDINILRTALPERWENESFLLLTNPSSFGLAYGTSNVAEVPAFCPPKTYLQLASFGVVGVASASAEPSSCRFALPDPWIPPTTKPAARLLRHRPSEMSIDVDRDGGEWLVVTEAYHPDWRVSVDGKDLPVVRAFGAMLAVHLASTPATVTLRFVPPWWYNASLGVAGVSWLVVVLWLVRSLLLAKPTQLH
jgi:hypothetical protein